MEESENITVTNFCYACLKLNDNNSIGSYNAQNESLRALFRMNEIQLCYLCKRIAQRVEAFILNVQSNQIWLDNFHAVTLKDLETLRTQINQPMTLSYYSLVATDIDPEAEAPMKDTFVIAGSHVTVKIEKDENGGMSGEFLDDFGADFEPSNFEPPIKEESDDHPLHNLKQELEINTKPIASRSKTRSVRVKKRDKTKAERIRKNLPLHYKTSKETGAEAVHIPVEQFLLEIGKRSQDKDYINSEFKCESCVKGFAFKGAFHKHMEKHSKSNGNIVCDLCDQRFGSREKMKDHRSNHTLRYRCIVCGFSRANRHAVKEHYLTEHCSDRPISYKCTHCNKDFRREISLRRHILHSHSSKSRVQCAYCGKTYACKETLKSHMIMCHTSEVSSGKLAKRHVCEECGKAFSAPSLLQVHMIKHTHRKDFYCVECDKSFKSEAILKRHLKVAAPHCNYLELPIQCGVCDKRFAIKRDLERHMNKIHLNIKPHQCDQCEKAYINYHNLREHQKLVHEGYKRPFKFPCSMCDKVFDRNQILKSHIRTHTGERPYQCTECDATFSQSSVLGTHYKLIHLKLTRDGRPKHGGLNTSQEMALASVLK